MVRLNVNLCAWIFCSIGCFHQLSSIIEEFFQFKVQVEVTYKYPEMIEIPDIDMYFPFPPLLNFTGLYLRYPEKMAFACKTVNDIENVTIRNVEDYNKYCSTLSGHTFKVYEYLTTLLTVGDIEELTVDPTTFIESVTLIGNNDNLLHKNICKVERFLGGMGIFMRVSCQNNSQPLSQPSLLSSSGNFNLLTIYHNISVGFSFRFSHHHDPIDSQVGQYHTVSTPKGQFYGIVAHYSRRITIKLPWPYVTECVDYNRAKVYAECLDNLLLLSERKSVFVDTVVAFGRYPKKSTFANFYTELMTHNSSSIVQFVDFCKALTSKEDCNTVHYLSYYEVYTEKTCQRPFVIEIAPQILPDLWLVGHRKLDLPDLLYAAYSILGIWFGINVYDKFIGRYEWLRNYLKAKKQNAKLIEVKPMPRTKVIQTRTIQPTAIYF